MASRSAKRKSLSTSKANRSSSSDCKRPKSGSHSRSRSSSTTEGSKSCSRSKSSSIRSTDVATKSTPKTKKGSTTVSPPSEKSLVRRKLEMSFLTSPPKKTKKIKAEDPKSNNSAPTDNRKQSAKMSPPPKLQAVSIDWTDVAEIDRSLSTVCPDENIDGLTLEDKLQMLMNKFTPRHLGFAFASVGNTLGVDMKTINIDKQFRTGLLASTMFIQSLSKYWNANGVLDKSLER